MYPFEYLRAETVAGAVAAAQRTAGSCFLAGGMSLIPILKQRLNSPTQLIDLDRLDGLRFVRIGAGGLRIGAMTTHDAVARSDLVQDAIPALARLVEGIGDPQVRHRGTLGGSFAVNDPAGDYAAAALALGATVVTDRRSIAADDFFVGPFETALAPDELITEVVFPIPARAGYAKFEQLASRYALVAAMAADTRTGPRVAVIGAAPCVFRLTALERGLADAWASSASNAVNVDPEGLNSNMHGSAEYRAHLVRVMASRAIADAG
jgi:Aerobic-type carbon monoxide dehydrogenase, middle subunit CoxM/CutM homologs